MTGVARRGVMDAVRSEQTLCRGAARHCGWDAGAVPREPGVIYWVDYSGRGVPLVFGVVSTYSGGFVFLPLGRRPHPSLHPTAHCLPPVLGLAPRPLAPPWMASTGGSATWQVEAGWA